MKEIFNWILFFSNLVLGYFNDDDILDFMVYWSGGVWFYYNFIEVVFMLVKMLIIKDFCVNYYIFGGKRNLRLRWIIMCNFVFLLFFNLFKILVIDGKDGVILWNMMLGWYDVIFDLIVKIIVRNCDMFLFCM